MKDLNIELIFYLLRYDIYKYKIYSKDINRDNDKH